MVFSYTTNFNNLCLFVVFIYFSVKCFLKNCVILKTGVLIAENSLCPHNLTRLDYISRYIEIENSYFKL